MSLMFVALQILVALMICSRNVLASDSRLRVGHGCRSSGGVDTSVLTMEQLDATNYQRMLPCEADSDDRFDFQDAVTLGNGEK